MATEAETPAVPVESATTAAEGAPDPLSALPLHEFDKSFHLHKQDPEGSTASGKVRRDDVKAPVAKATWVQMSTVMVADVVGVGVLSLAAAVAKLGWVLGLIMLFGFFPLNMYTGVLLSRTRKIFPKSVTMGDMALYCLGKVGMVFVAGYIYANVFFILGDYLLVTGQSMGMMFYDVQLCKPVWMAIGGGIIWILMQFSRTLHHASYLCWFNMACIVISIFIALIYLWVQGTANTLNGAYTQAFNPNLTIQTFFGAMGSFVFAYSGQFMYLELMAEMRKPDDFPKTFTIAGPFQVFMYAIVAITGYAYRGNAVSGFIINNIPYGPAYRASSIFLFLHMLVTYIIKGQILTRAIHIGLLPKSGNDMGLNGKLAWAGISLCVIALGWVCATAIPFFEYFSSLLGSLQALPTLILPPLFFIIAKRSAGEPIHVLEYVVMAVFCFVLGVLLIVFGLWGSIDGIISSINELGGPFSCQCHDIWQYGCSS